MSILDRMEQSTTKDPFMRPTIQRPAYSETIISSPTDCIFTQKHLMTVTIEHEFYCNQAQYEHAKKLAREIISSALMQSAIDVAQDLRAALYAEDFEAMHTLLNKLMEELR